MDLRYFVPPKTHSLDSSGGITVKFSEDQKKLQILLFRTNVFIRFPKYSEREPLASKKVCNVAFAVNYFLMISNKNSILLGVFKDFYHKFQFFFVLEFRLRFCTEFFMKHFFICHSKISGYFAVNISEL